MIRFFAVFQCLFLFTILSGQESIDETIDFQTENQKKYSIYVPSNYNEDTPIKLMVGLHPLNPSRWNSTSWRDTLIAFSEENELLLFCPDGGIDGRIDDSIDTSFTTFMIDSMLERFNINESQIYLMGFSWGGRTTYSYGLNHVGRFAGFIPIGAAMNGISGNESYFENAYKKPFFIVHGENDSPGSRYYPFLDALSENEACVESLLMPGVGHTIDFSGRNQILTDAFKWVQSQKCDASGSDKIDEKGIEFSVFPNPIFGKSMLNVKTETQVLKLELFDSSGVLKNVVSGKKEIFLPVLSSGIYTLKIYTKSGIYFEKIKVLN